mmetsp:Transcript_21896/g.58391  ORF Transcript_21896/g.58391 Transcript_21896/m.58391 type:complete len:99 (+) Transcript_21896:15-311(+)
MEVVEEAGTTLLDAVESGRQFFTIGRQYSIVPDSIDLTLHAYHTPDEFVLFGGPGSDAELRKLFRLMPSLKHGTTHRLTGRALRILFDERRTPHGFRR